MAAPASARLRDRSPRYTTAVKAAGDDHAAAPGPEPAPSIRVVVPGRDHSGGRQPAERLPGELAPADVEAAVNKHVEREPSAGTELQYPDTAALAVADRHQPDACDLLKAPDAAKQLGPFVAGAEQLRHMPPGPVPAYPPFVAGACPPSVLEAAAERSTSRPPVRVITKLQQTCAYVKPVSVRSGAAAVQGLPRAGRSP